MQFRTTGAIRSFLSGAALLRRGGGASLWLLIAAFLSWGALAGGWVLAAGPEEAPAPHLLEHFERHVRPLLVEKCQGCHGPDKQWAGLSRGDAGDESVR